MKKKSVTTSTGSGLSSSFVIGSVVAFCTTPTFVGWAGAGKSLIVGLGTSIGTSVGALAGVIGGGLGLGIIGGIFGGRKGAIAGAIGGAIIGAVGGGVTGAVGGYNTVKGWLLEKEAAAPFNKAAEKPSATADAKTLVLTPKLIAQYRPS